MATIFTIGYQGADLRSFLGTLQQAGVTHLLDVREIPLSRKKGFSKNALKAAAEAAGIDYTHERELGAPKAIRDRLYKTGDYVEYFKRFRRHLSTKSAALERIAGCISGPTVLVCYERDPNTCHRSAVAEGLADLTGSKVTHLGVNNAAGIVRTKTRLHPRQGVSAVQH